MSALARACAEELQRPELAARLEEMAARVARNGFQVVDLKRRPPVAGDALFHQAARLQGGGMR